MTSTSAWGPRVSAPTRGASEAFLQWVPASPAPHSAHASYLPSGLTLQPPTGDTLSLGGRARPVTAPVNALALTALRELKRLNSVSVYGSSQSKPGDGFYEHSVRVGDALARAGLRVVTGGGQGSMRGLAMGALIEHMPSLGLSMPFIGEKESADVHAQMRHFTKFSDRLDAFEEEAALSAAVPGGIGTQMELTNMATQLSTGKTPWRQQMQIVLFDKDNVYRNWKQHLAENFVQKGLMSQSVLDLFKIVDEHHIADGVKMLKANQAFTAATHHRLSIAA